MRTRENIRPDLGSQIFFSGRTLSQSVLFQGKNRQIAIQTTTSSPWCFVLLLAATLLPQTNAERVIESSKSVGMTTTAWILALVSTLVSVLAMVFVLVYRENKIVTVGQPFFLCMICFGSFLMSASLYFDAGSIEEIPDIKWSVLDKLCVLQLWCTYCGMLIVLVALICKLWRAEKACQFRKGQKILVQHVLWPLALIIGTEFILLLTATFVCPPSWGEVLLDPFEDAASLLNMTDKNMVDLNITLVDTFDKMPKCFATPLPSVLALQISSHALIVLAQIVVLCMAYQTRNIPEDIVDTKRVYYLVLCHFVLYVPFVLVQYGVIPCGKAYHYFDLVFPFLFSVTSVGFLVFPKVYFVFYQKRHGRLPKLASSILSDENIHVSGVDPSHRSSRASMASASSKRASNDTRPSNTPSHTSTANDGSPSAEKKILTPSNDSNF